MILSQKNHLGTFLVVQWLRLCASNAGSTGSIPHQGTKIPYASGVAKKLKKKKVETTWKSIKAWMYEQHVVYSYNGILFSYKN